MVTHNKLLLIDLDGTLIDTAKPAFKPMKDGKQETDVLSIPIFSEAQLFLKQAQQLGFRCIIISDSHPKYVGSIFNQYFKENCTDYLPLADKPNTSKTQDFLQEKDINLENSICYVLGDSWLDIELGRGLNVSTILTDFYQASEKETRDGIGDYLKNIKSGSTYFVKTYSDILNILKNPLKNLLCLESKFNGSVSNIARKPCIDKRNPDSKNVTACRILARQSQGECDRYHATDKYFEFSRVDRSEDMLVKIRDTVVSYLEHIIAHKSYLWHIFTYIPDKQTTQPSNKMGMLFDLIVEQIQLKSTDLYCDSIFTWSNNVNSSTRRQSTANQRREFIKENLNLRNEIDVTAKNVIILDDQYTTGATVDSLAKKLRRQGGKNVLFIALFHLITNVSSNRSCPECNKRLQLKINKQTGEKFYSCVLPKYGGNGCGYNDSGKLCPACLENNRYCYMKAKTNRENGKRFYSCVPPRYNGNGCGYTEDME